MDGGAWMFFSHPAEWQVPISPSITLFTSQPFSMGWLWIKPLSVAAVMLTITTLMPAQMPSPTSMIKPGQTWNDTKGKPIESHMGGVLFNQGVYYWYGTNFDGPTIPRNTVPGLNYTWLFNRGITIYQSKDLIHWEYASTVLADVSFDPASLLQPLNILCRPKIIRNDVTHQYILMAGLEAPNFDSFNDVVVAVSDSPTGPFKLLSGSLWTRHRLEPPGLLPQLGRPHYFSNFHAIPAMSIVMKPAKLMPPANPLRSLRSSSEVRRT